MSVYNEINDQKSFTYTISDGRKVTTQFEAHGDKTQVITEFDAEKDNSEEMQKSGWQSILNNFKKYVEAN